MMTLRRRVSGLAVLAMAMGVMILPRGGIAGDVKERGRSQPVYEPWAGDPDTPAGRNLSFGRLQIEIVDLQLGRLYVVPTNLRWKSMKSRRWLDARGIQPR
jgi:hypothetical protein